MSAVSSTTVKLIEMALAEDLGLEGDITSKACIGEKLQGVAEVVAKESLCVCGQSIAAAVCKAVDEDLSYSVLLEDGASAAAGSVLARISGKLRAILAAERCMLNFLQHLSGIATSTSRVVSLAAESGIKILDTRKTTPAWRELEKYAVRCGGGTNHRMGLYDAVMIKDNHVDALGGEVAEALKRCREMLGDEIKLQAEARNTAELRAVMEGCPDAILLDNMSPEQLREAVEIVRKHPQGKSVELEASGGITEENIGDYIKTNVDAISLGSLTHSVKAADISLLYSGSL